MPGISSKPFSHAFHRRLRMTWRMWVPFGRMISGMGFINLTSITCKLTFGPSKTSSPARVRLNTSRPCPFQSIGTGKLLIFLRSASRKPFCGRNPLNGPCIGSYAQSNPKQPKSRLLFVRVPPLYGWPVSEETKPSTLIFDSKAGRTLGSSAVNNDRGEPINWRRCDRGLVGYSPIVVSGCIACTNANRDTRPTDQMASRISGVFFICAIIPEHELVVREVVFEEKPDYPASQATRRCWSPSASSVWRPGPSFRICPSLVTSSKRTETCFETPDSCIVIP